MWALLNLVGGSFLFSSELSGYGYMNKMETEILLRLIWLELSSRYRLTKEESSWYCWIILWLPLIFLILWLPVIILIKEILLIHSSFIFFLWLLLVGFYIRFLILLFIKSSFGFTTFLFWKICDLCLNLSFSFQKVYLIKKNSLWSGFIIW